MRRTPVPHPVPTPIPSDSAEDMSPDLPFEEGAHDTLNPDLRHRMISEAAFYFHAQRGYREGYDLDDWLEAEARIDYFLRNPQRDDVEYTVGLA